MTLWATFFPHNTDPLGDLFGNNSDPLGDLLLRKSSVTKDLFYNNLCFNLVKTNNKNFRVLLFFLIF